MEMEQRGGLQAPARAVTLLWDAGPKGKEYIEQEVGSPSVLQLC